MPVTLRDHMTRLFETAFYDRPARPWRNDPATADDPDDELVDEHWLKSAEWSELDRLYEQGQLISPLDYADDKLEPFVKKPGVSMMAIPPLPPEWFPVYHEPEDGEEEDEGMMVRNAITGEVISAVDLLARIEAQKSVRGPTAGFGG